MRALWQRIRVREVPVWLVAMGFWVMIVASLRAQEAPQDVAATGPGGSFDLQYQEVESSFCNWSIPVERRATEFGREPADLGKDVVRGFLNLEPNGTNSIAFLWDRDAGKLWLDQNRNLDLTDDPDGLFTSEHRGIEAYQLFPDIHLSLPREDGDRRTLVDLSLYKYGARLYCSGGLRSLWAGKVTLDGRDWQVGIAMNPFGSPGSGNDNLLLRPWAEQENAFNINSTLPEVFDLPAKLFLNGQAYELKRSQIAEAGKERMRLQFVKHQPALGDLEINGEYIDRLALGGDEYLVLLDRPTEKLQVPVGRYNTRKVRLAVGETVASQAVNYLRRERSFSISEGEKSVLVLGGPLTNSVQVTRRGRSLAFSYQLLGADGEAYELAGQDRSKPPAFAVYHGDKQIASGKFEFG